MTGRPRGPRAQIPREIATVGALGRIIILLGAAAWSGCDRPVDVVAELNGPGGLGTARSCAGTTLLFHSQAPDVIVALDRAGSTLRRFGTSTRLQTETMILRDLVRRFEGRLRWGYLEFPVNAAERPCGGGLPCCADRVSVEPTLNNFAAFDRALTGCVGQAICSEIRVNTPTGDALRNAREYYAGLNDGIQERYVLLVADGAPNCAPTPDPCGAAEDETRRLRGAGVKTVVLGISEDPATDACLGRLALAGGAPRPNGPPYHYVGSDPDQLRLQLEQLTTTLATPSCRLHLQDRPSDPARVAVFFDRGELPRDPTHGEGWDWDGPPGARLAFFGAACARLQRMQVARIDVRAGCSPCDRAASGTCGRLAE